MGQLFRLQNPKNWKSLLVTADSLMLVNKVYKTSEEFAEKFQEKEFLKQRLELSMLDISQVSHPEKEGATAKIFYTQKGKKVGLDLIFVNATEQQAFVDAVTKPRKMIAVNSQVSVMRAIGPSLIGLAVTAFLTFVVYYDAEMIEMGAVIDTSGRRSLYKELFAWLGKTLGTQGTLIAGGAIGLLCIFFIYKNLQSRPMEVVYS